MVQQWGVGCEFPCEDYVDYLFDCQEEVPGGSPVRLIEVDSIQ